MPLSGVDGSKFNMKINLYVVSLDEHNVPRVERIQTTKDTKVLNTICLYYRIFFFHYKSCVVLLTSLKKKLLTMFTRCCAPEFALALLLCFLLALPHLNTGTRCTFFYLNLDHQIDQYGGALLVLYTPTPS